MKDHAAIMRRWVHPLIASVSLCLLFLAVYPLCNWVTSRRAGVGSFYFAWERHIPFVAWFFVPYMSMDLCFIVAPFLTTTRRELRTLVLRLVMAILVACICFLIFPLRFAFGRPIAHGMLGALFEQFRTLDLPFNQFPSLHIAQLFVLMDVYLRHVRRWVRPLVIFWSACIFASTLLTYQHHVIDVLGGLILAVGCFYFIRDTPLRHAVVRNVRVGVYYAMGAAAFAALSLARLPLTLPLLWPAGSLAIAALGYFFIGPGIFRKEAGVIPTTSKLMLWPLLLGQRVSLAHYARQCRAHDPLTERVWIGRRLSSAEALAARAQGVTAVVDLTGEMPEARPFRSLDYLNVQVLDLTAPRPNQIAEAVRFIERHAEHGIVYVHCKAGYSRTAVMAGAYLLASGRAVTAHEAVEMIRTVRPSVVIRPEAMRALQAYERSRLADLKCEI